MGFITSAAGFLALLDEPEIELQILALVRLNEVTDIFWPEISDSIQKIERLEEDPTFKRKELAALIVSKVFFHLGSYLDSLTYALRSGKLLHNDPNPLYIETMKVHAIDHYIKLRSEPNSDMNAKLEALLNDIFKKSIEDQHYRHAIGIALETHKMEWFKEAIMASEDIVGNLTYSYKIAMQYIGQRKYRDEVLEELVSLYDCLATPDYVNMSQCLIHLDKPQNIATILDKLIKDDSLMSLRMDNELMAYQIGFDLYESATQDLLLHIRQGLRQSAPIPSLLKDPSKDKVQVSDKKEEETEVTEVENDTNEDVEMKEDKNIDSLSDDEIVHQNRIERMESILSGEMTIQQHLQFLIANNHTDLLILKHTKEAVRASVCHTATVIANAFVHCGTTSDQFLRDNLDWLSRATNWAKMTATASLGVIHRGHEKEAMTLMQAYLPKENSTSPGYVESGALYALGLIHANHGGNIIDYLLTQSKDASNEVVRHGASLGLGLAAMSSHRADIYEQLKTYLLFDDAVTGEAAGIAMGLVMVGSGNSNVISDMVDHARDTQHEKILRGLAQGIALVMYGQQDQAEDLIKMLSDDQDSILRRAAMYTVAMAYCGTASTPAIKRLLHVAVSDVDNDVRRAAVEALGFLLFRSPEQMPGVVSLLAESYNPHVRYGAAMALGIACSGTGSKEALGLLEPLTNDSVNFVRQGALIASALVIIQHTESTCPKGKEYRQLYTKVISDKHEDSIAKFGAILAQGIIDAGGRNMTISLQSRTGHTNMMSVVGMFLFTQFWYWFPLSHFLSLAFTPTCLIGLNSELKMPILPFISNAKPSTYGYPAPLEEKKKEIAEKVTAVLSITAKIKRKVEKRKEQKEEKMEVDEEVKEETKKSKEDDKKKEESNFDTLNNPARVMKQQLRVVRMSDNCRYMPTKDLNIGGIILMRDTKPNNDVELVKPVPALGTKVEEEAEPEPPEPFEYSEDDNNEKTLKSTAD